MRIQIDYTNVEIKQSEKAMIKRQAEFLFSRLRNLIHSIRIHVNDANGPKGGIDKECTVMVKGKLASPVVIKDSQTSAIHATKNALHRANHAFVRKYKRKQLFHRNIRRGSFEFPI